MIKTNLNDYPLYYYVEKFEDGETIIDEMRGRDTDVVYRRVDELDNDKDLFESIVIMAYCDYHAYCGDGSARRKAYVRGAKRMLDLLITMGKISRDDVPEILFKIFEIYGSKK